MCKGSTVTPVSTCDPPRISCHPHPEGEPCIMYVTQTPQKTTSTSAAQSAGYKPAGYNAMHACRPPSELEAKICVRRSLPALYCCGSLLIEYCCIRYQVVVSSSNPDICRADSLCSLWDTCMLQEVHCCCCSTNLVGSRVCSIVQTLSLVHAFQLL